MKNKSLHIVVVFALVGIIALYGTQMMEEITAIVAGSITTEVDEIADEEINGVDIMIDPGHGGPDPGKVGINGALEKDLNLEIGKKLYEELEKMGYTVLMTREDDEALSPESEFSKVGDLSSRVEMINEVKPQLVVSIHQNSYSSEDVKGAQVFYYTESLEAKEAAQNIQQELLLLDTENTRQIKENDTYYLLKRTEVPTIIVECGFLSNAMEADKLIDTEYQQQLVEAIAAGITSYLGE
ncbi:MAG: N-acetylmuramoyl-L-alanine amidase [Eubacteriales bacterium]